VPWPAQAMKQGAHFIQGGPGAGQWPTRNDAAGGGIALGGARAIG
jgi:hypothetical protein